VRFQSAVGRAAAIAALVGVVSLLALWLFGAADGDYRVTARFVNAGQLVKGNQVQAGGVPVGSVAAIEVTPEGQADVTLAVDDAQAPLPEGTRATVRQLSLSGIANRYVDLSMPAHGAREATIPDGGRIGSERTSTQVDLDQVLNALDRPTRRALQSVLRGSARSLRAGGGEQLGRGIEYLNPGLSSADRLLDELDRERPALERTLVDSSQLMGALSERRDDLADLIGGLGRVTRAVGSQKQAVAESLGRLPPFLRRANTTFVNLRSTLDDLDPLVAASRPLARDLPPLLADARLLASGARPTLADLRRALRRRGRGNDAIELLRALPPLADAATARRARTVAPGRRRESVGTVPGAFPQLTSSLRAANPVIAFGRPYTTDFLGWLDDFSSTGGYFDALGGITRTYVSIAENIRGAPPKTGQLRRCPGAADVILPDRSNLLSPAEQQRLSCTEAHRAVR
jgi:phospholipid/cholesterol/gamma-HCH transport system substrate-binding protein